MNKIYISKTSFFAYKYCTFMQGDTVLNAITDYFEIIFLHYTMNGFLDHKTFIVMIYET